MTPRVISSMEPEICTEMLRNLTEKLRAKLPATTHGHSMVNSACLNEFFELIATPVEGHSLQQKDKKRRLTKGTKIKKQEKPKDVDHFLRVPSKKVVKHGATSSVKKGTLPISCTFRF